MTSGSLTCACLSNDVAVSLAAAFSVFTMRRLRGSGERLPWKKEPDLALRLLGALVCLRSGRQLDQRTCRKLSGGDSLHGAESDTFITGARFLQSSVQYSSG
jgi:hypothetical protein